MQASTKPKVSEPPQQAGPPYAAGGGGSVRGGAGAKPGARLAILVFPPRAVPIFKIIRFGSFWDYHFVMGSAVFSRGGDIDLGCFGCLPIKY
jgi:hypothetical protein